MAQSNGPLTKTEIYEELEAIINYMDPRPSETDGQFTARLARGVSRLVTLAQRIKRDVHE